jgi:hypothetical protein
MVSEHRATSDGERIQTYVQSAIVLQVGNNVQINVKLQRGSLNESVEVTAGATMVETRDNAISQVIDTQRIVDLPLNGRQPTQLILLSGAAITTPGGDLRGSKNFYSSTTISVAGGQGNAVNYLLDGGDLVYEREFADAVSRRAPGIQRADQQPARAFRIASRGRGGRRDEIGNE